MRTQIPPLLACINTILLPISSAQINIREEYVPTRTIIAEAQTFNSHTYSTGYEVRVTVSQGIGRTYEEASINAGENALKELSGMYINSRKSVYKDYSIDFGGSAEVRKIIRYDTSYYNDGEIKSFKTLDHENINGIHKVIARVEVWIGLNKVHLVNPLLNPSMDKNNNANQVPIYVEIESDGRGYSYESAVINALRNSVSQISTKIAKSPATVDSYREMSLKIEGIMPEIKSELKIDIRSGVSTGSKGIIESWKLIKKNRNGSMFEVRTTALVKLQELNHYLNHVR